MVLCLGVLLETIEPRVEAAATRPRPADMSEEEFIYVVKEWLPALCKALVGKSYAEADGPATSNVRTCLHHHLCCSREADRSLHAECLYQQINSFFQRVVDLVMAHVDSGLPIDEMYSLFQTIIDPSKV